MSDTEWKARAEREAAAIITEAMPNASIQEYAITVSLVAIGWIQGYSLGAHETLAQTERAFTRLQADLT